MPKRSRKTPRDPNELAAFILRQVTDPEPEPEPETDEEREARERKEAAAKLGRAGGLKGGQGTVGQQQEGREVNRWCLNTSATLPAWEAGACGSPRFD